MVMELYFSNQEELYKRLLPALRIKKKEFKKTIPNIEEEDIWNNLKNGKWNQISGLSLSMMVDDILHLTIADILEYLANKQEVI